MSGAIRRGARRRPSRLLSVKALVPEVEIAESAMAAMPWDQFWTTSLDPRWFEPHLDALGAADQRMVRQLRLLECTPADARSRERCRDLQEVKRARLLIRQTVTSIAARALCPDKRCVLDRLSDELASASLGVGRRSDVLRAPEPSSNKVEIEELRLRAFVVAAVGVDPCLKAEVLRLAEARGLPAPQAKLLIKNAAAPEARTGTSDAFATLEGEMKGHIQWALDEGIGVEGALRTLG